jgi:hypothetical protein
MRSSPPIHTAPPLFSFLGDLISTGQGPVAVLGSPRLARRLGDGATSIISHESADLAAEPGSLGGLIAVGMLGSHRIDDVTELVARWARTVRPGGLLAVAELAGESWAGNLVLRLSRKLRRKPTALDPTDLCRHLLAAGARPVNQVWPQGLGSWVLTFGWIAPLAHLKARCDFGSSADRPLDK